MPASSTSSGGARELIEIGRLAAEKALDARATEPCGGPRRLPASGRRLTVVAIALRMSTAGAPTVENQAQMEQGSSAA